MGNSCRIVAKSLVDVASPHHSELHLSVVNADGVRWVDKGDEGQGAAAPSGHFHSRRIDMGRELDSAHSGREVFGLRSRRVEPNLPPDGLLSRRDLA